MREKGWTEPDEHVLTLYMAWASSIQAETRPYLPSLSEELLRPYTEAFGAKLALTAIQMIQRAVDERPKPQARK